MLMEYMACGRPVIASYTSGHKDILNDRNALLLTEMRPFHLIRPDGQLLASWEESSLDELISRIEYAYHHREAIQQLGKYAGQGMRCFSWSRTAHKLLDTAFQ